MQDAFTVKNYCCSVEEKINGNCANVKGLKIRNFYNGYYAEMQNKIYL